MGSRPGSVFTQNLFGGGALASVDVPSADPQPRAVYRSHRDTFGTMPPGQIQGFNGKWRVWIAEGTREGWMLEAGKALKSRGAAILQTHPGG